LHRQQAFAAECAGVNLPAADAVAARCLSLPIYPELGEADMQRVVSVIADACGQ